MRTTKKSGHQGVSPDIGDVALAFSIAQNVMAALSNSTVAAAVASGGPAAVPYTAIQAAPITRKSSGKFLVTGFVTIDKNGGTLVAGDNIILTPELNAVAIVAPAAWLVETAAVTSAATVQAFCAFSFINDAHATVAVGAAAQYSMVLTTAGAHTSSVFANNGLISVLELPG